MEINTEYIIQEQNVNALLCPWTKLIYPRVKYIVAFRPVAKQ
jgi:hypothetical protein